MKRCKQLNHHKWVWQVRETSLWANCQKCEGSILVPDRIFNEVVEVGVFKGKESVRALIREAMGDEGAK